MEIQSTVDHYIAKSTQYQLEVSRTYPWEKPETQWPQGGPWSDTRDLWRRWWEGPSDPSVGNGLERWERLPPLETRRHEGNP